MHVTPAEFSAVRRDNVVLHYAMLGDLAYVLATFPPSGSRGTFIEQPCVDPHWGIVVAGEAAVEIDGRERLLALGSAFHVPAGLDHRIIVGPDAHLAGFAPVSPDSPTDAPALRRAGFEVLTRKSAPRSVSIVSPRPSISPTAGEVTADSRRMGHLVFTRVRLGRRSGYTAGLCDVAHWGVVVDGSLAIEWEDSVEVLTAGDVYYCPPGPPGHRLQAAEPAVVIDFTHVADLESSARVAEWRVGAAARALREGTPAPQLEVAALG